MEEMDLQILTKTVNGVERKNINLKPKVDKKTFLPVPSLLPDKYVILTKNSYAAGKKMSGQFGDFYVCTVEYKGENVGFFLNEKEHAEFESVCGVGEKFKVALTIKEVGDRVYKNLSFEQVK